MPSSRRHRAILAAVLIAVAIGCVVLGGFYIQLSVQSITLRLKESPFVSLGTDNLTVLLTFELRNPSLLSAQVVDLPFVIELAEYPLGTGKVVVPLYVPSNGTTETAGKIQMPYSLLPSVTVAALRQYLDIGTLTYRIYGTVTFRFAVFDTTVPFELRGDVFEDIYRIT